MYMYVRVYHDNLIYISIRLKTVKKTIQHQLPIPNRKKNDKKSLIKTKTKELQSMKKKIIKTEDHKARELKPNESQKLFSKD